LLSLSARFAADINLRRAVDDDSLLISNVIHRLQPEETTEDTKDSKRRTHQPSSFLGDEYRLELLHIPKTGGTMLEVLAMEHNITWGACHFEFPWRTKPKCILRNCPRPLMRLSPSASSASSSSTTTASSAGVSMLNTVNARNSSTTFWHYPHQYLREDQEFLQSSSNDFEDPYDRVGVGSSGISANGSTSSISAVATAATTMAAAQQTARKRKKFFVVVRNPYDRYLSLFYMRCECPPYTEQALNDFVQKKLLERDPQLRFHCQHDFVFDQKTRRRIVDPDHILHFEQLKHEFEHLVKDRYGMNFLVVPAVQPPSESQTKRDLERLFMSGPKMGPHNFTPTTLHMIHTECGQDFDLGPYNKMIPIDE
jgi:Sulfotransferase family